MKPKKVFWAHVSPNRSIGRVKMTPWLLYYVLPISYRNPRIHDLGLCFTQFHPLNHILAVLEESDWPTGTSTMLMLSVSGHSSPFIGSLKPQKSLKFRVLDPRFMVSWVGNKSNRGCLCDNTTHVCHGVGMTYRVSQKKVGFRKYTINDFCRCILNPFRVIMPWHP